MSDPILQLIQKLPADKRAILAKALQPAPEPIAIVGMACRFPGNSLNLNSFWQLLEQGRDGIIEVPADRWNVDTFYDPDPQASGKMYTRYGGFLPSATAFDADFFGISPREALRMDPQQRLLMEVTWEALENAQVKPSSWAGSQTGVFMGILTNQYTERQMQADSAAAIDDPYFGIGTSNSVAAGRISYFFDFQGPSLSIDTACSSSLVALHLACESLRQKECEQAIVGGVHVVTLPESMINACKMRMLAMDGRCKTFDAQADGFAIGEGCGVVVLKKLSDAQRDGDNIFAIVRGSAVNEDGRSSSLTAPNGLAQQAVMRRALKQAKLEPSAISYIEAHGSGTALGDPIEMESIQAVYGQAERPLYAATVKTNIGHLTAGAGVAGLIKTVLALQHKTIPPHLNFKEPNPNIPWSEIGVQLPLEPVAWQPVEGRYLAGVNSFGWSGTNAHIILEAGDTPATHSPSSNNNQPTILPLSAHQPTSVLQYATQLAEFLQHTDTPLPAIATALQTRETFNQRVVVAAQTREEAIKALNDVQTSVNARTNNHVTFMFPGLGDQYAGMAQQLYETDTTFRQTVDHCCQTLTPILDKDLRELIYPADGAPAPTFDFRQMVGRGTDNGRSESNLLNQTRYAQPALFVIEYALAQWWLARGADPQALIGYSLGEYVAACLAGVFSLEDGLTLVAERAKLIDALPQGSMLAVALPYNQVAEMLPQNLSICAINGPLMMVVGGEETAVQTFAHQLKEQGHVCRPLQTTHAFHSHMMEPICEPFRQLVSQKAQLNPPTIPILSNVTGTWLTAEQATSPDYWVQHLRQPIQLAQSLHTLWQKPIPLFLEVGIGQTLTSLALQHLDRTPEGIALSSLPTAYAHKTAPVHLHKTWGQLWQAGVSVRWAEPTASPAHLPNYAWSHQTYWVDYQTRTSEKIADKAPLQDWFYLPTWQRQPNLASPSPKRWLLFLDDKGVGTQLVRDLPERAIVVTQGSRFERLRDTHYTIDFAQAEQYKELLKHLHNINQPPERVVDLRGLNESLGATHSFRQVLFLSQALIDHTPDSTPITFCLLAEGIHDLLGAEPLDPNKATLLGLVRVLPKEQAHLQTRLLDLRLNSLPTPSTLIAEIEQDGTADELVAYRGNGRWVQTFAHTTLSQTAPPPLKPKGVYLITGGFGGLGMALAKEIVQHQPRVTLILLARTPLPPRTEWATVTDEATQTRLNHLRYLEEKGATVYPVTADASDYTQLSQALTSANMQAVDGIFHLAGVPGEGLIQFKTEEMATAVFAPKIDGTKNLARYFSQTDFMVLYSSSNALLGGPGEVDYCAANAFLDTFAQQQTQNGRLTIAIDWGAWQWDAWQSSILASVPLLAEKIAHLRQTSGISFDEGHNVLWRLMQHQQPHWLILTQPLDHVRQQWETLSTQNLLQELATNNTQRFPRPNIHTAYVPPRTEIEKTLADIWAEALAIEQVGINDHFFELGGNSLIGLMIISKIEKAFDIKLSAAALYEGPTISTLSGIVQPDTATETLAEHATRGAERRNRREQQRNRRRR